MTQNTRFTRPRRHDPAGRPGWVDLNGIKDRIDLGAIALALLGPSPGRRGRADSRRMWWHCPFHEDANPSFCVTRGEKSWHCFGCAASGDAIALVMRVKNCGFPDAIRWLDQVQGLALQTPVSHYRKRPHAPARPTTPSTMHAPAGRTAPGKMHLPAPRTTPSTMHAPAGPTTPAPMVAPPGRTTPATMLTLASAVDLVEAAVRALWSPKGKEALRALRQRGLADRTIQQARLGFTPAVTELADRPFGIVIPWHDRGRLAAVKLRQPDGRRPKYREVYRDRPCLYPGPETIRPDHPLVIVEGEFDALLLGQELEGLAAVVTLGSASTKLDQRIAGLILASPAWYIATDHDAAGDQAAARWPARAQRVLPPEPHKDWTAAYQAGADLRRFWLGRLGIDIVPRTGEVLSADMREEREERAAIMEYDGGLSREAAERAAGLR